MRLKRKVKHWVADGLISAEQGDGICRYEGQKLHDKLFNSLRYAGYFAILLGVALVIASNWDVFGAYTKLFSHLAINTVLAFAVWKWRDNPERKGLREIAVYFLCGLTLTLLALIGQTFQLQGALRGLWTIWVALISGFVIMIGKNPRIASLWCLALAVAIYLNAEILIDLTPEYLAFFSCLFLATGGVLILYMFARSKILQKLNEEISDKLAVLCGVAAILGGAAASFIFYEGSGDMIAGLDINVSLFYIILSLMVAAVILMTLTAHRLNRENDLIWVFAASAAFMFLPFYIPFESAALAAMHFIAFMVLLGFIAAKSGHDVLLSLALFAVSARLFIVFLELFGSMLSTGVGLIIAGIVLSGIVKATLHVNKKIRREIDAR